MFQTSSTPVSSRPPISAEPLPQGAAGHVADGLVEPSAGLDGVAHELPPRLLDAEGVDARPAVVPWDGEPDPRRVPEQAGQRTRGGPKARTPTAAAAPVARMADGEVTARATFGL